MYTVGTSAGYALQLTPAGHIHSAILSGVRLPIDEVVSTAFTIIEQYPTFNWGANINPNMSVGPTYHVTIRSEQALREVTFWMGENGDFFILTSIHEIKDLLTFRYQFQPEEAPGSFSFLDELNRPWEVRILVDPELFKDGIISTRNPTAFQLAFSRRQTPLTVIITDNVEEAALLSSILGHERRSLSIIPPDVGQMEVREFTTSPMMRTLIQLGSERIVYSEKFKELAQVFNKRCISSSEVLKDAEELPILRTPKHTLPEAVVIARENKMRVVIDEAAPALTIPAKARMVFYESNGISSIVAANFAFDSSAGLKVLPTPSSALRNRWAMMLAKIRTDRRPKALSFIARIRSLLRRLALPVRGQTGNQWEKYQSEADELIATLAGEVGSFYRDAIGEVQEACAYLDSVDIPLSLGLDLPIGHIPNTVAPYWAAQELAWMREERIAPYSAVICDPGVTGTEGTEIIDKLIAEMLDNNWVVYSYGPQSCNLDVIFRFQLADFIYLITHGSQGQHTDRGMVEHSGTQPLLGKEMAEIRLSGRPLMFNNACTSWPGFGSSALRAGACTYVGTLWPVFKDLAIRIGASFKRYVINGDIWSHCLNSALADMPIGEKAAYFMVGSGFRNFASLRAPNLTRTEIAIHGLGINITDESYTLSTFRQSPERSLGLLMWLTLRAASRINVLPEEWQWLAMAQTISVTSEAADLNAWRMSSPVALSLLEVLRASFNDESDSPREDPTCLSPRAALREVLFDLHMKIASTAARLDDWATSQQIEQILYNHCEAWGHADQRPVIKNNLAKGFIHLGQLEQAEPLLLESLSEKAEAGLTEAIGETLLTWTILIQMKGEHEKAISALDGLINSWSLPDHIEDISTSSAQKKLCIALANRAQSLVATGRVQQAIDDLKRALAGFRMLGLPTDIFKTHIQLAHAHNIVKDFKEANYHLAQARSYATELSHLAPNIQQAVEDLFQDIENNARSISGNEGARVDTSSGSSLSYDHYNLSEPPPGVVEEAQARIEELKLQAERMEKPGAIACVIGWLYFLLHKAEEAIPWYRKWEAEGYPDPQDSGADWKTCALGYEFALRMTTNAEEVERAFRSLISRSPTCSQLITEYGTWLFIEGRYEEARPNLEKGLQLDPEDTQAMCYLGEFEEKFGSREEAINLFGRAVQLRPDAEIYNKLGMLLEDEGQTSAAIVHYNRAALLGMHNAYWNIALIEAKRSFSTGVKINLQKYLECEPKDVEGWLWLSRNLFTDGSFEHAVEVAQNALILEWSNPGCIITWLAAECGMKAGTPDSLSSKELEAYLQLLTDEIEGRRRLLTIIQEGRPIYINQILLAILCEQEGHIEIAHSTLQDIVLHAPKDYLANMLAYRLFTKAGQDANAKLFLHNVTNQGTNNRYARLLVNAITSSH